MNCPTCNKPMDTSMDKCFETWTCHRCGWKLRVRSWAALEFYWKNDTPIEDVITISKTTPKHPDMEYHTPTIRDERSFVAGDIGYFITHKLTSGKSYKIMIKIVEDK